MKSKTRKGIRLGLVAGLVASGLVGVTSLTASGQASSQQVVGELVLTVPGGTGRTGTVQYFAADADGAIDGIAEATQTLSAASACDTITNTGDALLNITTTPAGSRPVLPNDGLGILTSNQNCGTSGVIDRSEAMRLSLNTFFGDNVRVSETDLTVFRPDSSGGNLTVGVDGGGRQPVPGNLVNGLNPPRTVAGFENTLDFSSTSSRFNKGILLRGATFTLVTDVQNDAPVANFTFLPTVLDVQFTDASTDADGTVQGWSWDFGDGTTSDVQNPTHTYATSGTYPVTLTVTDNLGRASTQVSKPVTVVNQAPVADFTSVPTVLDVQFTDASTDADGTVQGWSWDFGDGTTSDVQNPTHTYATSGTYPVTLTVTDNLGRASTPVSKPVTVVNQAPVADFTFDVNVLDVEFTDASTDADGTVQGWSWDFGDGTTSDVQNPFKTYAAVGTYEVTLSVKDDRGLASEPVSQDVTVKFDEAVDCGETAPPVSGDSGEIATTATFFRGENGDKFGDVPCEDVGVIVDIVNDDYVFWDNSNVGVFGNDQAVNGLVTIEWAPVPVAQAERLEREIDYVGDGLEFTSTPWCTSFSSATDPVTGNVTFDVELPDYSGAGSIDVGGVAKAPWCLVSDERVLNGGVIDQTVVLFGGGDPRMR